jgi:hypothetical protein
MDHVRQIQAQPTRKCQKETQFVEEQINFNTNKTTYITMAKKIEKKQIKIHENHQKKDTSNKNSLWQHRWRKMSSHQIIP